MGAIVQRRWLATKNSKEVKAAIAPRGEEDDGISDHNTKV
jgi:hypothetical protein